MLSQLFWFETWIEYNNVFRKQFCNINCVTFSGYDFERKRVLTRVPNGNFISTRGTEGKTVYLSVKDEMDLFSEVKFMISFVKYTNNIFSIIK